LLFNLITVIVLTVLIVSLKTLPTVSRIINTLLLLSIKIKSLSIETSFVLNLAYLASTCIRAEILKAPKLFGLLNFFVIFVIRTLNGLAGATVHLEIVAPTVKLTISIDMISWV